MHSPRDECADQDAEHRIAGDRIHEDAHTGRILGRGQRAEQDMQRQQHQAEADGHAADILDASARPGAEGHQPDDEQRRSRRRDIERKHLNDQRGADIRTEHDCQRRYQPHQTFRGERTGDQPGCGAALEQGGKAQPRGECGEPIAQRLGHQQTKVRTEGTQNAALDHVKAPKQQRYATHQVKKNDRSHTCS